MMYHVFQAKELFITNAPSDKLIKIVEGASFTYTVVFIIKIIGGFIECAAAITVTV